MFQAVSPPIIRSSKTVHTASGICQACLLLPLAVAVSKLDIYQMVCIKFLSSWWWAEKPPETCRALTVIKNIVYRCILLVILKKYINDARYHERKKIEMHHVGRTSGWSMIQAVSPRFLTAEVRVRSQLSSCKVCGKQTATGTG